jgi:hypothetical protein
VRQEPLHHSVGRNLCCFVNQPFCIHVGKHNSIGVEPLGFLIYEYWD